MVAVLEPAEAYGWMERALNRYDEASGESWPPKKHAINPWRESPVPNETVLDVGSSGGTTREANT